MSFKNDKYELFDFMSEHGHTIKTQDFPIIAEAIRLNSKDFLTPPAIIKELSESTDAPYVCLAQYALNKLNISTSSESIDFELSI